MSKLLGSEAGKAGSAFQGRPLHESGCFPRQKAVVVDPPSAFEPGGNGYADWIIVALHGLREYLDHSYRRLLDVLQEVPGIAAKIDLAVAKLPDFTTVCVRMQTLQMAVWCVLLRVWVDLSQTGDVQAIGATGFDRRSARRRYARRTNYSFSVVKTTVLVDCQTSTILDIHCSMKRPHGTQIGEQVFKRNLDRVETITADKGYDWDELWRKLRETGMRLVSEHRKFSSLDAAQNARLDDDIYHRRFGGESVIRSLEEIFGNTLRART